MVKVVSLHVIVVLEERMDNRNGDFHPLLWSFEETGRKQGFYIKSLMMSLLYIKLSSINPPRYAEYIKDG